MTPSHARSETFRNRTLAVLAIVAFVLCQLSTPRAAAADTLTAEAGKSSARQFGSKMTTAITRVQVKVPNLEAQWGVQLRATSKTSGYLLKLATRPDGNLTGAIKRVSGSAESTLTSWTPLGFKVRTGQDLKLEATVTGLNPVRIYLRVWPAADPVPVHWQVTASDSTSKRHTAAGYSYIWAGSPAGTARVTLSYGPASATSYTAAAATKIGVLAPLAVTANTFSFAVVPDTQAETSQSTNSSFLNRVDWLAKRKDSLDLRYALHTGDVTNWGWLDRSQLERANSAMSRLKSAGIPYALTIGNHDTRAVGWDGVEGSTGYGGAAYMYNPECPERLSEAECKSWLLVRQTQEFNQVFPLASMGGVGGAFEAGKVDNYWTTFQAGGANWLVLTLEPWPRKTVVTWAQGVLAANRSRNVIMQTHHYLTGGGNVSTSNAGYGETSPQYLYDQLVKKNANIKMIFSGHTGAFAQRVETVSGNRVVAFLGNNLGAGTNPVRVVTVDTASGRLINTVYNPLTNTAALSTAATVKIVR